MIHHKNAGGLRPNNHSSALVRFYTKPAYQAYNRSYEYFSKTVMRYCARRRINYRNMTDPAILNVCRDLDDYSARMQEEFLGIAGSPCTWEPDNNPNRNQFDVMAVIATKADQSWINCIKTYDRCLIDLLQRAENGLVERRKVNHFKYQWKTKMVATSHAFLSERLAGVFDSAPKEQGQNYPQKM